MEYSDNKYNVYFVSMGAPSLYMLLRAIDQSRLLPPMQYRGTNTSIEKAVNTVNDETIEERLGQFWAEYPDEVVYVDLGFEYPEVLDTASAVERLCATNGITFTRIRHNMREEMFNSKRTPYNYDGVPINDFQKLGLLRRGGTGYGWCGGRIRWGTAMKKQLIERHLRDLATKLADGIEIIEYIGFTNEESHRTARGFNGAGKYQKRYPLIEAGFTKAYCIRAAEAYCKCRNLNMPSLTLYAAGLTHIGCWCCRNHNIKEICAMRANLPHIYSRLVALEEEIKEPYYRSPRGWAKLDSVRWQVTKYEKVKEGSKDE